MRALCSLCFAFFIFAVSAEDMEGDSSAPTIIADISKDAQESAVSFDGFRGLFGLGLMSYKFGATAGDGDRFTNNNINSLAGVLGIEYAKTFRKGFLVAVTTDISVTKGSKDGSWKDMNSEYDLQRGGSVAGNKVGKLKTNTISPFIGVKCGYVLPKLKSVAYAKMGVLQTGGSYQYEQNGTKSNDNFKVYAPAFCLGFERKLNSKWGASLEAVISIKKSAERKLDSIKHKTKAGYSGFRVLAIYSSYNEDN
ncbi:MAG: hypothetical protein LBE95_00595 [Holosporaceae bacterium]|jgi:hypothetical protein|nr:hypothetical protein [Holosporaceae bacterium]